MVGPLPRGTGSLRVGRLAPRARSLPGEPRLQEKEPTLAGKLPEPEQAQLLRTDSLLEQRRLLLFGGERTQSWSIESLQGQTHWSWIELSFVARSLEQSAQSGSLTLLRHHHHARFLS